MIEALACREARDALGGYLDGQVCVTNTGSLPTDGNSTIVRSFFNTGFGYRPQVRLGPGSRSAMLVDSIPDLLSAVRGGRVQSYYDVIERSR